MKDIKFSADNLTDVLDTLIESAKNNDALLSGDSQNNINAKKQLLDGFIKDANYNPDITLASYMRGNNISRSSFMAGAPEDLHSLTGKEDSIDIAHLMTALNRSLYKHRGHLMIGKMGMLNDYLRYALDPANKKMDFGTFLLNQQVSPDDFFRGLPTQLKNPAIMTAGLNDLGAYGQKMSNEHANQLSNYADNHPSSDIETVLSDYMKEIPVNETTVSHNFYGAAAVSRGVGKAAGISGGVGPAAGISGGVGHAAGISGGVGHAAGISGGVGPAAGISGGVGPAAGISGGVGPAAGISGGVGPAAGGSGGVGPAVGISVGVGGINGTINSSPAAMDTGIAISPSLPLNPGPVSAVDPLAAQVAAYQAELALLQQNALMAQQGGGGGAPAGEYGDVGSDLGGDPGGLDSMDDGSDDGMGDDGSGSFGDYSIPGGSEYLPTSPVNSIAAPVTIPLTYTLNTAPYQLNEPVSDSNNNTAYVASDDGKGNMTVGNVVLATGQTTFFGILTGATSKASGTLTSYNNNPVPPPAPSTLPTPPSSTSGSSSTVSGTMAQVYSDESGLGVSADGHYNSIGSIFKSIGKDVSTAVKNIGKDAKKISLKGVGEDLKKAVEVLNRINPAMVLLRGAVEGAIGLNVMGLATDFEQAKSGPHWNKITNIWEILGGNDNSFNGTVNSGSRKKKFGADGGDELLSGDERTAVLGFLKSITGTYSAAGVDNTTAPSTSNAIQNAQVAAATTQGNNTEAAIAAGTSGLAVAITAAAPAAAPFATAAAGTLTAMGKVIVGDSTATKIEGIDEKTQAVLDAAAAANSNKDATPSGGKTSSYKTPIIIAISAVVLFGVIAVVASGSKSQSAS